MLISFIQIIFLNAIFAQSIEVQQLNPQFDAKELESTSVKVKTLNELNNDLDNKTNLIAKSKIDSIFKNAGLETDISKYDQVDRDQFYIRASYLDLKNLQKNYPNIPEEKLLKLKYLIKENNKKTEKK